MIAINSLCITTHVLCDIMGVVSCTTRYCNTIKSGPALRPAASDYYNIYIYQNMCFGPGKIIVWNTR